VQLLGLEYIESIMTQVHVWKRYDIKPKYVKDLLKVDKLKYQHRYYFPQLLVFVILLLVLIGPVYTAYLYSIPAVYIFYATGVINSINHISGKPNNIAVLNLITSGESYHKNHHDDTQNWKFGKYDPMIPFIQAIKK
jgi:fatty-acid desaturase